MTRPQFHLHTSVVVVGFLSLLFGLFRAAPSLGLVWLACLVPATRFTAEAARHREMRGRPPGPGWLVGTTFVSSLAFILIAGAIALVPAWLYCFFL